MNMEQQKRLSKIAFRLETKYSKVKGYRTNARDIMTVNVQLAITDLRSNEPFRALSCLALNLHEASRAMKPDNPEIKIYAKAITKITRILWPKTESEQPHG